MQDITLLVTQLLLAFHVFPSVEAMQLSTIGNLLGLSRKNLGAAITLSGLAVEHL